MLCVCMNASSSLVVNACTCCGRSYYNMRRKRRRRRRRRRKKRRRKRRRRRRSRRKRRREEEEENKLECVSLVTQIFNLVCDQYGRWSCHQHLIHQLLPNLCSLHGLSVTHITDNDNSSSTSGIRAHEGTHSVLTFGVKVQQLITFWMSKVYCPKKQHS